jgi:PAS domain S-box-containing protein
LAGKDRLAFLLQLSDTLRPLADPAEIEGEACRLLREHLGADHAYYVHIDEARDFAVVEQDHVRGGLPSLVNEYALSAFRWLAPLYKLGRPVVVADLRTSELVPQPDRAALAAARVIAWIAVPLVKNGVLVGALCVAGSKPRPWSEADVTLVQDTGERIWAAIERARAETALFEAQAASQRQQRLYEAILTNTPDLAYIFDRDHRFIYANEGLLTMWGKTRDEAIGKTCLELGYEPWHAAMHDREIDHVIATKQPVRGQVPFTGTFGRRIYDYIFVPVIGVDGEVEAVAGTTRDVTDALRTGEKALAQKQILEMIAIGKPLDDVLDRLIRLMEAQELGMRCSVLLVSDDRRHFRGSHGPSLPDAYHTAFRGMPITPPYSGPCGESAHQGIAVQVPDITAATQYTEAWRNLMRSSGLQSGRSIPVLGTRGEVRGALAIYFDHPRDPNPADSELIDMAAHLAAIAIERDRSTRELLESKKKLSSELAAARQLQAVSISLIQEGKVEGLYQQLVEAAANLMKSDAASIQVLDRDRNALQLKAWKGFEPQAAAAWEWVEIDATTSCGVAFNSQRRVVIPDIEACDAIAGTDSLQNYRQAKLRSMQSTPLVSRSGDLLGMISTHWRVPHEPSESDLRQLDVLARQAADLVERTRAEDALKQRAAQLRLMVDELNHRVKNTLATVQSLVRQTLRNAGSKADGQWLLDSRLVALSKAHDVLTREHWEGADIHEVVANAMSAYASDGAPDRIRIGGPQLNLRPKAVLALSMALHELATNAVKYGALSTSAGCVSVNWGDESGNDRFRLRWNESGGPPVVPPRRRGFGSRLVEQGLAHDLGGEVRLLFGTDGLTCTIDAPLGKVQAGI